MKRWLCVALAGAALLTSIRLAAAQAPNPPVRLVLSSRPVGSAAEAAAERPGVLRPNVEQEVLTYVQNNTDNSQTVTVQLLAGGAAVASSPKREIAARKFTRIDWPRPPAAPGAKDAGPTELAGPVAFRLLDAKGEPLGQDIKLAVDHPDNYLEAELTFIPPRDGGPNHLVVKVTPKKNNFKGPPCPVQLVLDPDRIPGLLAGQKKKGVYAGYATADKNDKGEFNPLYLAAEDIRLRPDERSGVVMIRADGYDRAFAFLTDFPPSGTPPKPERRGKETLRLKLPPAADPRKPVPVVVEADNLEQRADARIVLEVVSRVPDEKGAARGQFSLLEEFRGERDVRLFFRTGGANGGLLFKPQVKDWGKALNLGGLHGKTTLRLRLLDKDGKPREVLDGETGKTTHEVIETIDLDDTPPEGVRFVKAPRPAVRGKPFFVQAQGFDDESGIRDVVFFLGKLPPDANLPPDAIKAAGKRPKVGEPIWTADLVAPVDARVPLEVSVRFTNKAGLSTTQVIALELADPPPPAKVVKKGSIAGVVMEGDRPQKGLPVDLLAHATGRVLATTKTAADGTFAFKELDPGEYRVTSVKTASNTRGTSLPIPLAIGQDVTGITIKLWR